MTIREVLQATGAIMVFCCTSSLAFDRGEARFDFRVVDDANQPVENARIQGGAWWPTDQKALFPALAKKDFDTVTDTNGMASVEVVAYVDVRFEISKERHYRHNGVYQFGLPGPDEMSLVSGRWRPWPAPRAVTLKRVLNPIPMYAKRVDAPIPVLGQAVGYDLEKSDWVGSYGRGVVSDMVFCVTGTLDRVITRYGSQTVSDLNMAITFSNTGDGIQTNSVPIYKGSYVGSLLVSSHEAPVEGYNNRYDYVQRARAKRQECINVYNERDTQIAYLRVRTDLNEDGEIKKAWYGKMYGDLCARFTPDGTIRVCFTYYLNPDGTRNVEFDPKRNLLTGLKSLEQVSRP